MNKINLTENRLNGAMKVSFAGRLDAEGAKELEYDLDDCMHRGEYNILLGLEEAEYISSAGIRILLLFRKKLKAIDGSFSVTVSEKGNVKEVLEMSGLTMLIAKEEDLAIEQKTKGELFPSRNADYEILNRTEGGFNVSIIGASSKLKSGIFVKEDVKYASFPTGTVAMGIGAFGDGFENCIDQFGEFLALGGVAMTRPPSTTEIDYIISQEEIVPKASLLSGMKMEGEFDSVFRFSPKENIDSIALSVLCREALNISGGDSVVMVAAVEVADLVGVSLLKSPARKMPEEDIFSFPGIRDWFSFSGEPIHKGKTALIAGIVSEKQNALNGEALKSIGDNLFGTFKAGIFSYDHLSRDEIDLTTIAHKILEHHKLYDLLHLVNDRRKPLGVGESKFLRGTVWCGRIFKENL